MEEKRITLCGVNCGISIGYLAMKSDLNKLGFKKRCCAGCLLIAKDCVFFKKNCDLLGKGLSRFYFKCGDFSLYAFESP